MTWRCQIVGKNLGVWIGFEAPRVASLYAMTAANRRGSVLTVKSWRRVNHRSVVKFRSCQAVSYYYNLLVKSVSWRISLSSFASLPRGVAAPGYSPSRKVVEDYPEQSIQKRYSFDYTRHAFVCPEQAIVCQLNCSTSVPCVDSALECNTLHCAMVGNVLASDADKSVLEKTHTLTDNNIMKQIERLTRPSASTSWWQRNPTREPMESNVPLLTSPLYKQPCLFSPSSCLFHVHCLSS